MKNNFLAFLLMLLTVNCIGQINKKLTDVPLATLPLNGTEDMYVVQSGASRRIKTSAILLGSGTINQLAYWNTSNTISSLTTSTYPSLTELSYIKGLTSPIQTQISSLVPQTRTLTINSTTFDLSTNRTWTITAAAAGSSNYIQFNTAGSLDADINFTWNKGSKILQVIGGISSSYTFKVINSVVELANPSGITDYQVGGISTNLSSVFTFSGTTLGVNSSPSYAGINLGSTITNPSTLNDADIWYISSAGKFAGRQSSTTVEFLTSSSNNTGGGSALLGSNSPAITNTSPYTWIKITSADGSTVYIPAWK